MPQKRFRSKKNSKSMSDRSYEPPGHTKYSHRMLLVKITRIKTPTVPKTRHTFIKDGTNPENRTELLSSIEKLVDYTKRDGHDMLINTLNSMPRRLDIVVEKRGSFNY